MADSKYASSIPGFKVRQECLYTYILYTNAFNSAFVYLVFFLTLGWLDMNATYCKIQYVHDRQRFYVRM